MLSWRYWRILTTVIILFCLLLLIILLSKSNSSAKVSYVSEQLINYEINNSFDQNQYNKTCFKYSLRPSIEYVIENLDILAQSQHSQCRKIYEIFNNIYQVEIKNGNINVEKNMEQQIKNWMGGIKDAVKLIENQKMIHIINRYTQHRTIYTPLRSKRPNQSPSQDPLIFFQQTASSTQLNCDFCNPNEKTAKDLFGRLESNYSLTAANMFKLSSWHGMVISQQHNFLAMNHSHIVDMLLLAKQWFEKVHEIDGKQKYPMWSWDLSGHAGASQFHPHIQLIFDEFRYYGELDRLQIVALAYSDQWNKANYLADVMVVHKALGLYVEWKTAVAFVELTERGDCEVTVTAPDYDLDLATLFYFVLKTFSDEMKMYSFSAAAMLPIMGDADNSFPALIKISTRGTVNSLLSEVSSFDLYLAPASTKDPYQIISALRKTIDKWSHVL